MIMMTSSNGNIFRVTGHLRVEFTGPRWIPRTKASDGELRCFALICVRIKGWENNREADDLRSYRAHYDVTVITIRISTDIVVSTIIRAYWLTDIECPLACEDNRAILSSSQWCFTPSPIWPPWLMTSVMGDNATRTTKTMGQSYAHAYLASWINLLF